MTTTWRTRLLMLALLATGTVVFGLGITWGLPSRAVDAFLFGDEPVWSGEKVLQLAGGWARDASRGADVDANPLTDRSRTVCLNQTDAQRAEIIRRYRLYTYHPDEMVTFRALASMDPARRDFDPKLYQYGGLWVYPVGVLLKLASMCRVIALTGDPAYYLDHPEAFARFYVVARLYVAAWALVGVWVVFRLTRRWACNCANAGAAGALFYISMPVVMSMSHEAKPHLPGVVLMLLAVEAALRYVETGRRRWWLATACVCGAAVGMVLTCWPIFVVLPVMLWLRETPWRRLLAGTLLGGLLGLGVYFVTNPYVLVNLFVNWELLRSNLANTRGMFEVGPWSAAMPNALLLVGQGTSMVLAVVGAIGAAALLLRRSVGQARCSRTTAGFGPDLPAGSGWLLAAPALLSLAQFAVFAAGQAGEYARFALFCDVALAIAAVVMVRRCVASRARRWAGVGFLLVTTALPGGAYLAGFIRDSRPETTRLAAARQLQQLTRAGLESVGILAEPAPYSVPPVDLFGGRVLLLPKGCWIEDGPLPADALTGIASVVARHVDVRTPSNYVVGEYGWSPIGALGGDLGMSWADKRFIVVVDEDYGATTTRRADDDHAR